MRQAVLFALVLGCLFIALSQAPMAELYPKMDKVVVLVEGIESDGGTLRLHAYDRKSRWMKERLAVISQRVPAKKGRMRVELELPVGRRYALALHHDENDNGKVDTGFPIPKPIEPVGASYFTGRFIPRYYECSFKFVKGPKEIQVSLRRP